MRSWAVLLAMAGACGGNGADAVDAPQAQDAIVVDGEIIDATPVDASPIDAEIIDAPPAVCEPVPAPPTLPPAMAASGTRLVPRQVAEPVTGGVEVPYQIWDAALGIDCEPLRYHDGTLRCVPLARELHLLAARRYADQARTIPIAVEPLGAPPAAGTLAAVYSGGVGGPFGCGTTQLSPFARIGAPRSGTQYYGELGAAQTVPAGYGIFELDIIPDDFVELSEVRTQLTGPIAVRELHGTDGSRLFATDLWDTAHDVTVAITDVNGTRRLLPPLLPLPPGLTHLAPPPSGVVDATWCASHDDIFAAPNPSGSCPASPPRFVRDSASRTHHVVMQTATLYGCVDPPGVDAQGAQILAYLTRSYLASCEEVPISGWQEVIRITAGSGRLTTPVDSIGGAAFAWDRFRRFADTTLGIDCQPRTAADGALRCLPIRAGTIAFSDAACTSRIAASNIGPAPYALEGSQASDLFPDPRGTITVYAMAAARPPGPIWVRTRAGCTQLNNWTSYEIGGELPPSMFTALELRDAP